MFGVEDVDVDLRSAYRIVQLRASLRLRNRRRVAAGLATAAAITAVAFFTPLGGYASQLLTVFEPREFVPLALTSADRNQLRLAPELVDLGTLRWSRPMTPRSMSLAKLSGLTGFHPRLPADARLLPSGGVRYSWLPAGTLSFTFSAAKASAYERRVHRHLPDMPPGLDGSTVQVTSGPGMVAAYGTRPNENRVTIVETRRPRVTTTGVSLDRLERYLFSLPGLPLDVVKQLRAISDPSTMLPVSFQIDRTTAEPVAVDGTQGLAIGDQTGLGAGVLWHKAGVLYALGGTIEASKALELADGLR
ncbi:MAG TPA: hypothetical protein VGF86_03610 [Candidatus Tumulicola sp.]|jgi:hypothetical protein